jgi:hypothetical protein
MATTFEVLIELLFYIFIYAPLIAYENYKEGKYLNAFLFGLLAVIIIGGIIALAWYAYTSSRGCPAGQELFIVQRDVFNLISPEYSIYKNKAPVGNYDTESYPPVVRVDTPTTNITTAFFPQFDFVEPQFNAEYSEGKYQPLTFRRMASLSSLVFPSYEILKQGQVIGSLVYPTTTEEASLLGLIGLEKRYVIDIEGERYVTSEEFIQFKFIKEIYFYKASDPEMKSIAVIKPRAQASGTTGVYTVCLSEILTPKVKEALFASVIAYDQHVFAEERS